MSQVNEIESWVTDQEKMVTADNIGQDLPHVHHQLKKFAEVAHHPPYALATPPSFPPPPMPLATPPSLPSLCP